MDSTLTGVSQQRTEIGPYCFHLREFRSTLTDILIGRCSMRKVHTTNHSRPLAVAHDARAKAALLSQHIYNI